VATAASATNPVSLTSPPPRGARRSAADQLRAASDQAQTWAEWLSRATELTQETLQVPGLFVWEPATAEQPARLVGLSFPVEGLSAERRQSLHELAERAAQLPDVAFGGLGSEQGELFAAVKLPRPIQPTVLLVPLNSQPQSRTLAGLWLPFVAVNAELWSRRNDAPAAKPHPTRRRTRLALASVMVAMAAMALPVPYSVTCDCELQPVTRRFVAAPFEGALEQVLVEVGDTVTEGQLLARMDGKEVRWEQAGNTADYERAAKERDAHLAAQEFGEAQLAKLQMERLRLTRQMLERRGEQLEIRSPLDGIVVSGELKRVEGARLSMGQTLFEIAPLDQMIVEVEIPEAELASVRDRTAATIRLEAFAGDPLEGTLQRICPRAELRRKQQVFIGEIPLPNHANQLRPGMRGRVSLSAGQATLGWRLFHRALTKLRLWWG
jgi:RND family efflux transporter MFP subunit